MHESVTQLIKQLELTQHHNKAAHKLRLTAIDK